MIVLDNGDLIEGDATNAAEVDFSIYGLDNNVLKQLADGQLADAKGTIYTADSTDVVTSIILVNNGALHNHVNLYFKAATSRRLIPKDLQLEPGYSLHFEGGKVHVLDAAGQVLQSIGNITGLPGLLADDQHVLDAEVLAVAAAKTHGPSHLPAGADPIGLPKFSARKNGTNQTGIVTAQVTKVTFTTEDYDVGSKYDAANSKWIPGIIGRAHISVGIVWVTAADQALNLILVYKNGVSIKQNRLSASGTETQGQVIGCDVSVTAAEDYFEIYCYQGSGSNKDIDGDDTLTWFMGHMLP